MISDLTMGGGMFTLYSVILKFRVLADWSNWNAVEICVCWLCFLALDGPPLRPNPVRPGVVSIPLFDGIPPAPPAFTQLNLSGERRRFHKKFPLNRLSVHSPRIRRPHISVLPPSFNKHKIVFSAFINISFYSQPRLNSLPHCLLILQHE